MKTCCKCGAALADDERFCGECGAPQEPARKNVAEDPEQVKRYEASLAKYMDDGVLEEWEAQDLARIRATLQISEATHERLMAAYEPQNIHALLVAVDEGSIEEFAVGNRCMVRVQLTNAGDRPLVNNRVYYRIADDADIQEARTQPIPPGTSRNANLQFVPQVGGHYQLQVVIVAADVEDVSLSCRVQPVPFKVGSLATGPQTIITNTSVDMSGARASMLEMGNTAAGQAPAQKTGGILDQARWRSLKVMPISNAELALWTNQKEVVEEAEESTTSAPTTEWRCPEEWARDLSYACASLRWRKGGRTMQTHLVPRTILHAGKSSEGEIPLHLMPDGDVAGTEAYKLTNQISRKHLMLRYEGDRVRVIDLGSTFGTYHSASGELEPRRPTTLREGDRLVLSPKAPGSGHRLTGTDGIMALRVELGERTESQPLSRDDEEAVRRSLDDVHALDGQLLGADKPGKFDWVRLSRVGNGPEHEYVMHLGAVSIGAGRDHMIRLDLRDHRDSPPAQLVWLDGALYVRNPGELPVRVGSRSVTQGLMCPLAGGDVIEVGECEIEVSVSSGMARSRGSAQRVQDATRPGLNLSAILDYSGPDGQSKLSPPEIARKISANPNAAHHIWKAGWSGWKPWREVPEIVEAMAMQTGHTL